MDKVHVRVRIRVRRTLCEVNIRVTVQIQRRLRARVRVKRQESGKGCQGPASGVVTGPNVRETEFLTSELTDTLRNDISMSVAFSFVEFCVAYSIKGLKSLGIVRKTISSQIRVS